MGPDPGTNAHRAKISREGIPHSDLQTCCEQLPRYCSSKGHGPCGPMAFLIFGVWGACVQYGIKTSCMFFSNKCIMFRARRLSEFCGLDILVSVRTLWATCELRDLVRFVTQDFGTCATNIAYGDRAKIRRSILSIHTLSFHFSQCGFRKLQENTHKSLFSKAYFRSLGWDHGQGIMKEESWRRTKGNHWGGIMEEGSGRRNHEGGFIAYMQWFLWETCMHERCHWDLEYPSLHCQQIYNVISTIEYIIYNI